MKKERYQTKVAVFLMLTRVKEGVKEILLQKRVNTGYMDNMYDMACSGHLEKGESLAHATIREAKEEIGIDVKEEDLKMVALIHPYQDDYLNVFFETEKYEGTPEIKEPNKCDDLKWFNINDLPENTIVRIRNVLENIKRDIIYDDDNFTNQKYVNYNKM